MIKEIPQSVVDWAVAKLESSCGDDWTADDLAMLLDCVGADFVPPVEN
jgi:hypothetical protein